MQRTLRFLVRLFILCLALGLLLGSSGVAVASGVDHLETAFEEIVVKFRPGTDRAEIDKIHRQNCAEVVDEMPEIGVQVVRVSAGALLRCIDAYVAHPQVEYAEPNPVVSVLDFPQAPPDDPHLGLQWNMLTVKALEAWEHNQGSSGIRIAVLDSGIDLDHPDLGAKVTVSQNLSDSDTVDDVYGHGTHVAGIAAAITSNSVGVAGLGYHSSLMNVKILGDDGHGSGAAIAEGILWATNGPDGDPDTDDGAHVINMSLGTYLPSTAIEDAVHYAWSHGVVLVAAAGNHGSPRPCYPARYPEVIAVAGTSNAPGDSLMPASAHGDWVDVAAPGESIWSTWKDGGYGYQSGTSMASPHVAGLAALLFASVTDSNEDGLLNDEVRYVIESTCTDTGADVQYGLINAYKAVTASVPTLGAIRGQVREADTGRPIYCECSVKAGSREDFTDTGGNYVIPGVPPGTHDVVVSARGYPTRLQRVTLAAGEVVEVDFDLDFSSGGCIRGLVKDMGAAPIEGATVTDGVRQVTTGADGSYTLEDVPPGSYTVTASAPAYLSAGARFDVREGEVVHRDFILPGRLLSPLLAPYDPYPMGGATGVPVDAGLRWAGGHAAEDDSGPVTYHVYFGPIDTPPLVSPGQMGTTYHPGTLEYNTRYWWKVVAYDSQGQTAEGPIWSFITESRPLPEADFLAGPTEGSEPLTVQFTDASVSRDVVSSWLWDFGDGSTSTEPSPSHVYTQQGTYSVTLTVTAVDGSADTVLKTDCIVVLDSCPDCRFSMLPDQGSPLTVGFSGCSISYDDIVSRLWDFGDGTSAQGICAEHTYAGEGLYTVTLMVMDADGSAGVAVDQIEVVLSPGGASTRVGGEGAQRGVCPGDTGIGCDSSAGGDANWGSRSGQYIFTGLQDASAYFPAHGTNTIHLDTRPRPCPEPDPSPLQVLATLLRLDYMAEPVPQHRLL